MTETFWFLKTCVSTPERKRDARSLQKNSLPSLMGTATMPLALATEAMHQWLPFRRPCQASPAWSAILWHGKFNISAMPSVIRQDLL